MNLDVPSSKVKIQDLTPLLLLLPFAVAELPPLYDFYHWVFEGHLFASLAFGGTPQDAAIDDAYALRALPVPNMAATGLIGALNAFLPPLVAGRLFAALCALSFAFGFAFLARSFQGRRTAMEMAGTPLALGFFVYKGYLSYVFCLGLAFFATGAVHRVTRGGRARPGSGALVALAALAVLLYLAHLLGWAIFVGAAFVYASALTRQIGWGAGAGVALAPAASFALAMWYALASAGRRGNITYASWGDKLRSLLEPWTLFVRTDPIPPPFPTGWIAVSALAAVVSFAVATRERGPDRKALGAPLLLALALAAVALALPFNNFQGMNRPDGRLIFPAVLIAALALPYRRATVRSALVAGALAAACVTLHAVEYRHASVALDEIRRGLDEAIPKGEPGLSLTIVLPGERSGCGGTNPLGLHLGRTDTLRWFGLLHQMEGDGVRASLMITSVVTKRYGHDDPHDLKSIAKEPWQTPDLAAAAESYADAYAYVEIFGCQNDVGAASRALSPYFEEVATGPGYSVLLNPAWTEDVAGASASQ